MRWIRDTQTITLEAAGGDDTALVTMAGQDRNFRELTIWCEPASDREVGDPPVAKSFTAEVFFGPTSQGSAAVRVNDDVFMLYDPGDTVRLWPANEPTSNPQQRGTRNEVRGFPIVVQAINLAATPVVLTFEFLAMTIDQG